MDERRQFVEAARRAQLAGPDKWLDPPGSTDGVDFEAAAAVSETTAAAPASSGCEAFSDGEPGAMAVLPDVDGATRAPAVRSAVEHG